MLTDRQQEVLDVIRMTTASRGFPPSLREIGSAVGLSSVSSVHAHLKSLVKMGAITRTPGKPRSITLADRPSSLPQHPDPRIRNVPLVGRVAAGSPILAIENIQETMALPVELVGNGTVFLLEVRGDSMVDAGILDGDLVAIHSQEDAQDGEIVVALVDNEEATIKRLRRRDGTVILEPENSLYEPMVFTSGVEIVGKVVGVFRQYR